MRTLVAAVALFASLASVGWAGVSEDAAQVIQRWGAAFDAKDLDGITKLYAPDAQFWGTASKTLVTSRDGVQSYCEQAFSTIGTPKVTVTEQKYLVLSDAVVMIATMDAVAGTRDGKEFTSPGRTTWVIAKRDSGWRIIHFHRSSVPK
jgi:uncharacterized protein (TIGR02246 family)